MSIAFTLFIVLYSLQLALWHPSQQVGEVVVVDNEILLPLPRKTTSMVVEEAILHRRSIRDYTGEPITIEQLSMILWAAQGITNTQWRFRAAPSAGATYPLEIYVVVGENSVLVGNNTFLEAGVYKYDVYRHSLVLVKKGDYRAELARAALDQRWVREAAVNIVICAVYERTTSRYGERGIRYVHMEVGHVGQNIYLMATALGLGTVAVGAFFDDHVADIINAEPDEHPLYIMPIGVPARPYVISFEEINSFYESMRR
ncbi:SagB/ThcOx family dehydrogenase [Desulfurococcaceae archaeon MEX13E-LK6-19]|nr:SagB/ThcOx family dehydrogenase [Desulfurococcaceae archaeon MEX13E-LK6-19]